MSIPTLAPPASATGPQDVPADAERPVAYPPRHWWLRRLVVFAAALLVSLLLLRLAWGWEAERRLRRAYGAVAARGGPVRASDLLPPAPEDARNGAYYLKRAAAAVDRNAWSPANTAMDYDAAYPPHSTGWMAAAAASVAANGPVFPLVRRARETGRADWGVAPTPAGVGALTPQLNNTRMLINTVGDAAMHAHEAGDDVAALEMIRDVRAAARAVGSHPLLYTALVGIGGEALALARLQEMTPGLRIASDVDLAARAANETAARRGAYPATRPAAARPVTPANVRGLIAELLDDGAAASQIVGGYAGERALFHHLMEQLGERTPLLRPMWKLDAARAVDPYEALIEAASQPNVWAAGASLAAAAPRMPGPAKVPVSPFVPPAPAPAPAARQPLDYTRVLSSSYMSGMASGGRAIEQHLRVVAERRLAAVNLAAQLYRAEHGRWPAAIESLVPDYLPEVPADPMAVGGGRLRYLLVPGGVPGGDRPIVYHAGRNGVYDTQNPPRLPNVPLYGWTNGADEWRDLSRWLPAPAGAAAAGSAPPPATPTPSTQAADDEPQEADDPGDDRQHGGGEQEPLQRDQPPGQRQARPAGVGGAAEQGHRRTPGGGDDEEAAHGGDDLQHPHDRPGAVGLVVEARLPHHRDADERQRGHRDQRQRRAAVVAQGDGAVLADDRQRTGVEPVARHAGDED